MIVIEIILLLIVTTFTIDLITGQKLKNPYIITGIFGKPGSGKSTLMTKMMYKDIKKGWTVYSDSPNFVEGVHFFNGSDFKSGKFLPDGRNEPKGISLYFDEMGILYNNRDFKNNLSPEVLSYIKTHRHKHVRITYGSQSYKDTDLKWRVLTQVYYLCKRGLLQNFTVARRIRVILDINNNDNPNNNDQGGQIIEKYEYDLPIFWKFTLLPYWIKKFDSYR